MTSPWTSGLMLCVTGALAGPVVAASVYRISSSFDVPAGSALPAVEVTRLAAADVATHPVEASTPASKPLDDSGFVKTVAQDNMLEIAAADVALMRSKDGAIREYAQRIKSDHTAAGKELKMIATQHKLAVPAKADAVHAAQLQSLRNVSAGEFDRAYRDAMVKDHQAAVKLFSLASQTATLHADLRDFAERTLPTLQAHLNLAYEPPAHAQSSHATPPDYVPGASASAKDGDSAGSGPEVR